MMRRGLCILVDLFRKKIWIDAKCAKMITMVRTLLFIYVATIVCLFLLDCECKSGNVNGKSNVNNGNNGSRGSQSACVARRAERRGFVESVQYDGEVNT